MGQRPAKLAESFDRILDCADFGPDRPERLASIEFDLIEAEPVVCAYDTNSPLIE